MGGATQVCRFDKGLYLNPGPWRLPYHHHAVLDYCRRFGVALQPFVAINHNAFLHSAGAFGGKPVRLRQVKADLMGHMAELLAKVTTQGRLDAPVTPEDQEILLDALRAWGALDKDYRYRAGPISAEARGYEKDPGGGLSGKPVPGEPIALPDLLKSRFWDMFFNFNAYEFQGTMLQPVGGMDRIGQEFARRVGDLIRYDAKVTEIRQDERGVTVSFEDARRQGLGAHVTADWCVCTIPLSILSQIPITVGPKMKEAIAAVPYASSVKIGLQFKRRFWEEDEAIYGGASFTDLPIETIAYPNFGFHGQKGVLLGAYPWDDPHSYELAALDPAERVRKAVAFGAMIHPQYEAEFENGIGVAWHRVPFTLGCSGNWTDETRVKHYDDLCAIDGRIVLAGEHASWIPGWQEGALLSALDAVGRLHRRVLAG
jgi:monoamine oxidase